MNHHDGDDDIDGAQFSEVDMATCLRVLNVCSGHPELVTRDLRKALHPLVVRQIQSYEPINYGKRVTECLSKSKWGDALVALTACSDLCQFPKQGTVQRWVRDVATATPVSMNVRLLTAILKLTSGTCSTSAADCSATTSTGTSTDTIDRRDGNLHDPARQLALLKEQQVKVEPLSVVDLEDADDVQVLEAWIIPSSGQKQAEIGESSLTAASPPTTTRVLYSEKAADRTPPNHHDLLLHYCEPGYMQWEEPAPEIRKTEVPFCAGAFCLSAVLSKRECLMLRDRAEALGFRPDHPTSLPKPTGIDSCEWFVDDSILEPLLNRVRPFLPATIATKHNTTVALCGLNARWRFFRYGHDCVYRPHIDGSWPESTIDADGNYCSNPSASTKSYLTFLIYLNDNFTGGETRFYQVGSGGMTARGVVPQQGAVLCFPQGNTESLIHEGSAVSKGSKFVIRTDVLYQIATK